MYPFERFTEDAKRTLTLAQEEAERSHNSYIGTEHLLLGLLRVQKGTAYRVLTDLGVHIATVREVIVQSIIPTSRVKKVIELSFEEARRMGHNEVDTGHILLGLIVEGEGIAAHVLTDLGATLQKVRPAIERELGVLATKPGSVPTPPPLEGPVPWSAATGLLSLLSTPHIARLLMAKGVDTDALSKQLAEPPPMVNDMRARLEIANHALHSAVESQDFEVAATLRDEVNDLAERLAKAEEEWLESLA